MNSCAALCCLLATIWIAIALPAAAQGSGFESRSERDFLLRGRSLVIVDSSEEGSSANSVSWSVGDRSFAIPRPGSPGDPRCNGAPPGTVRASLRFFSRRSGQDTGEITLPCQRWTLLGSKKRPRGYNYADPEHEGVCSRVEIKRGYRSPIWARCASVPGTGLEYELTEGHGEGRVGAVLRLGGRRYCNAFRGRSGLDGRDGRRFVGRRAAAPAACPRPSGIPPEVVRHAADWPLANRDYANRRATTDSAISSSNVEGLELAWFFPTFGCCGFGNLATNPIILGDTVYVQELDSEVHALDFKSGQELWSRKLEVSSVGPNGVAVGYGRLFAANGMGEVVAMDTATGEELWRRDLRRKPSEGIDIQPVVFNRRVYVSTVPVSLLGLFQGGVTGALHALDVATGEIDWRFDTVDSADIWGNPEVNSGGGSWYPPAVDVHRGITYWGTGNPAPFPGTAEFPNGTSRPGPNLYTNSVLAVRAGTGKLLWYHQVVPHDLLDHDFALTALAEIAGRRVVVGAGKSGSVHAFDAANGRELWKTSVGVHFNDDLGAYPIGEELLVSPGVFGGVLTPPAIADGVVYVAVLNNPTPYQGDATRPFAFDLELGSSEVIALDLATGARIWTRQFSSPNFGGVTVVNDLLLTATFDGTVLALDRATGETLWSHAIEFHGINGWPAVAGDTIVVPVGLGQFSGLYAFRIPALESAGTSASE